MKADCEIVIERAAFEAAMYSRRPKRQQSLRDPHWVWLLPEPQRETSEPFVSSCLHRPCPVGAGGVRAPRLPSARAAPLDLA